MSGGLGIETTSGGVSLNPGWAIPYWSVYWPELGKSIAVFPSGTLLRLYREKRGIGNPNRVFERLSSAFFFPFCGFAAY